MTPRSRKPVIIGAMRGLTSDNYHQNFINFDQMDEIENSFECENKDEKHNSSLLNRSKSENSLQLRSSFEEPIQPNVNEQNCIVKSNSDETLSTPFRYKNSKTNFKSEQRFIQILNLCSFSINRKYLFSRSLLMTTPVDSSFSSQSDDFENLNDSEMSESLIYCLNGNEPIEYVGLPNVNEPSTSRPTSRIFSIDNNSHGHKNSIPIKRPLKNDDDIGTNSISDPIYGEYNAKKNHLELDETAL